MKQCTNNLIHMQQFQHCNYTCTCILELQLNETMHKKFDTRKMKKKPKLNINFKNEK